MDWGWGKGRRERNQLVHFFPGGRNGPVGIFPGEETNRSFFSPGGRFGRGKKLTVTSVPRPHVVKQKDVTYLFTFDLNVGYISPLLCDQ